jgi:4-hydroxy-2-oxoheptanedioate aldolase
VIENTTKRRLAGGETLAGSFFRYPVGTLAEFMALGGWDFLVLDAEHGGLQPRDVEDLSRACELHGTTPIVRVTTNEASTILRFLDAGAHGVQIPWVESGAAAEAAVQAAKYQPRGSRGLAATRSAGFGIQAPYGDYVRQSNRETLLVAQIESAEGAANIEDIVDNDAIDVIFIGPTDLSNALGHVGSPSHPDVRAAIDRITEVTLASDKALGAFVGNAADALAWRDRGARYLCTGFEGLMAGAIKDYLEAVRTTEGDTT